MNLLKSIRSRRSIFIVAALCFAMASALALSACSGQSASSGSASSASGASASAAAVDTSSWKTLDDALATETEAMSSGWNDDYYITMFKSGDSILRVVAKLDAETNEKINAVDWSKDNVSEQISKAAGTAEIVSVEDVTSMIIGQDVLDQQVGKTGKDLIDEGYTFEHYFMYGGPQTGASFTMGYLSYMITFDISISEDKYEDKGASIMDAKIVEASFGGSAQSATDPTDMQ